MNGPRVTEHPPGARPIFVWDGDCGFCARSVDWLRRRVGRNIEYIPYQEATGLFPDAEASFPDAVRLIEPDGVIRTGAAAFYRALDYGDRPKLWRLFVARPTMARVSDWVYRWVSRHRPLLSRIVGRPDR